VTAAVRRVIWTLGAPARWALIGLIRVYRVLFSGSLGGQCRFYPSCSHYGEEAIRTHGAVKGSALTVWRIARCGPFTEGGVDRVPPPRNRHGQYDAVTLRSAA
jgi:uncharacterized protein